MFKKFVFILFTSFFLNKAHAYFLKDKYIIMNDSCKASLKFYKKIINDSTIENGIIVRKLYIQCEVSQEDNFIIFSIGLKQPLRPIIYIACNEVINGDFANNYKNGNKTGLWFYKYPWGGIRKIEMYEKYFLYKKISFYYNGNIHKEIYYKNGKKKKFGNNTFDKNGKSIGHPNIGGW